MMGDRMYVLEIGADGSSVDFEVRRGLHVRYTTFGEADFATQSVTPVIATMIPHRRGRLVCD